MVSLQSFRAAVAVVSILFAAAASAQPPGPPPARSPRDAAQVDLTGNWVAQVTEDWRWRMITPPKGEYASVPLNQLGRQVADGWDPAAATTGDEACRAFGAGGIMRLPTRLKVAWADENTLRIETDLGRQVRVLHFNRVAPVAAEPSWQGHSVAEWLGVPPPANPFGALVAPTQEAAAARGRAAAGPPAGGAARAAAPVTRGSLKVVTTNLRAGYLRKNGVPFSENAFMTEYYTLVVEDDGNQYLVIQTFVADPRYLTGHFVRTLQFKRESDGSKRNPVPCSAT